MLLRYFGILIMEPVLISYLGIPVLPVYCPALVEVCYRNLQWIFNVNKYHQRILNIHNNYKYCFSPSYVQGKGIIMILWGELRYY